MQTRTIFGIRSNQSTMLHAAYLKKFQESVLLIYPEDDIKVS